MSNYNLFLVSSFSNHPFLGNPATVIIIPEGNALDESWMQGVASTLNQAETAFVKKICGGYELRWFSPIREVELCGHATLAAAKVLWSEVIKDDQLLNFKTKYFGWIQVKRKKEQIELNFPIKSLKDQIENKPIYTEILNGTKAKYISEVSDGFPIIFFELQNEHDLINFKPNLNALRYPNAPDILVTSCSGDRQFDFVSRYFAPGIGIDEDYVTGSAHCVSTPYWAKKLSKKTLRTKQLSTRQGELEVELLENSVLIRGSAVIGFRGEHQF